ncbi:unnamed protein product, partial [Allacma fusca]
MGEPDRCEWVPISNAGGISSEIQCPC